MNIKALSVKQPWASRIAYGGKTIESRTWSTEYRGPLLICSSKTPPVQPAGFALCLVDLVHCRLLRREDSAAVGFEHDPRRQRLYAWVLANKEPIVPFRVVGQLGLFDVPWNGLLSE